MGLGLSIVERLCTLLGHPIELTSMVGRGSRFCVTIPAAPAPTQFIEPQIIAPVAPDIFDGKLAVVIDDEALVLREARASGHHLLHKPVRPMRLRAMVSQLLQDSEVAGAA